MYYQITQVTKCQIPACKIVKIQFSTNVQETLIEEKYCSVESLKQCSVVQILMKQSSVDFCETVQCRADFSCKKVQILDVKHRFYVDSDLNSLKIENSDSISL